MGWQPLQGPLKKCLGWEPSARIHGRHMQQEDTEPGQELRAQQGQREQSVGRTCHEPSAQRTGEEAAGPRSQLRRLLSPFKNFFL